MEAAIAREFCKRLIRSTDDRSSGSATPDSDDIRQQTTGRLATQPPDSDDMRQHRRQPPDDMRQQANGRPCSSGRGAAKFTPIYSYLCIFYGVFTGYLLGSTVFAAYFGVFLPKFGRFSRDFGPQMGRNWRDLSTRRQLCDICQQTNGRPCGNVLKSPPAPVAAPAPGPGCRAKFIHNALHSGRL